MNIRDVIKFRLRRGLGILNLEEKIEELNRQLKESRASFASPEPSLLGQLPNHLAETDRLISELNRLTGKFFIALEYPPSRDYRPRWGYTHPPHQGIIDLFSKNIDEYCEVLRKLVSLKPYLCEINRDFDPNHPGEPGWVGGPINAIDSALLYYFISELKPKTYLEIGSGVTTLFAARAKRDRQIATRIISIDPEPRAAVDAVCDKVIREGLENTDLSIFSTLEPGDIVFMDGSHRSFMNSDVTVFMLDVLPKLKPGIVVHFHDIVLPYDYPEMFSDWYWSEQYILAAYLLAAGDKVKILMPSRFMSDSPEIETILEPILQDWQGSRDVWLSGGSLWFTHTR